MSYWRMKYKESVHYKLESGDQGYIAWMEQILNKAFRLKLPGYQPNATTSIIRKPLIKGE